MKEVLALVVLFCGAMIIFGFSEWFGGKSSAVDESDKEQVIENFISETEIPKFEETTRMYRKSGFGEEYYIYRFESTDLVVFYFGGNTYYLGKYVEEDEGPLISTIVKTSCQFVAFSQDYMLFQTPDDCLIAKEIEESQEIVKGDLIFYHKEIPFEELTEEEQKSFVYPIECEKITDLLDI